MKQCTGCEAEIATEAKTCPYCGAKIAAEATDRSYSGLTTPRGAWKTYALILAFMIAAGVTAWACIVVLAAGNSVPS
jgi:hypothetical protein